MPATAEKTPTPTLIHPEQTPAVKAARAAMLPAAQRQDALAKKVQRFTRVVDSFSKLHELERISPEESLIAEAELPGAKVDLARATVEARHRAADVEQALDAERTKLLDAGKAEMKAAVAFLIKQLEPARVANAEIVKLQQRLHELTGLPYESVAWLPLGDGYQGWLETLRSYGLLDAE